VTGAEHSFVPSGGAPEAGAATPGGFKERWSPRSGTPLLRFENETAAFVEVNEARAGQAARVTEGDGTLEYVLVMTVVAYGGMGSGNLQEVAELGEEELVVGAFGGGGVLPATEEGGRRHENTAAVRDEIVPL